MSRLRLKTPAFTLAPAVRPTQLLQTLGIELPGATPAHLFFAARNNSGDNSRSEDELGVTFRSAGETIRDTVEWLASEGHL